MNKLGKKKQSKSSTSGGVALLIMGIAAKSPTLTAVGLALIFKGVLDEKKKREDITGGGIPRPVTSDWTGGSSSATTEGEGGARRATADRQAPWERGSRVPPWESSTERKPPWEKKSPKPPWEKKTRKPPWEGGRPLKAGESRRRPQADLEPRHTHAPNVSGSFDPVTGNYALPPVQPCVCPSCGAVTDTSRRFCYKCDADLTKH